jgi:hypothetical protein
MIDEIPDKLVCIQNNVTWEQKIKIQTNHQIIVRISFIKPLFSDILIKHSLC